jgi:hypothetical protein
MLGVVMSFVLPSFENMFIFTPLGKSNPGNVGWSDFRKIPPTQIAEK